MPTETIIAWKSKRLSDESIKSHATSGKSLGLKLKWIHNSRIVVERIGSRSKQLNLIIEMWQIGFLFMN